jgi:hypothetical protein
MTEPERFPPPFWHTRYFERVVRQRPDRWMISPDMIAGALRDPARIERERNGRIRRWGYVAELKRWLRVVTLTDGETVHNAFLDRNFKP